MDDTLQNITLGFLALFSLHYSLERRARNDAARQVQYSFQNRGTVRASVQSEGPLGLFANRIQSIDIYADGQKTDHLPFNLIPRRGWKGSIQHLRLHFTHFSMNNILVDSLNADIPDARYDLGRALYNHRLLLRSASTGNAEVRVRAERLGTFIALKYGKIISNVTATTQDHQLQIAGKIALFGSPLPFTMQAALRARSGRYIDLSEVVFLINNLPVSPSLTAGILKQVNPVLDMVLDLPLQGVFVLDKVLVDNGFISIRGFVNIPKIP